MIKYVGLALVLAALTVSGEEKAQAASSQCTVSGVFYLDSGPSGTVERVLTVVCGGTNYFAFNAPPPNSPNCSTVSMETVKSYEAIGLASKLAGTQVTVFSTPQACAGTTLNIITSIGG